MAIRLLFVVSVAAALLVLAPESASAHCHEPTAYHTSQAAVETLAQASSDSCGQVARQGGFITATGLALSAAAYAGLAWLITALVSVDRFVSAPPVSEVRLALERPNADLVARLQNGEPMPGVPSVEPPGRRETRSGERADRNEADRSRKAERRAAEAAAQTAQRPARPLAQVRAEAARRRASEARARADKVVKAAQRLLHDPKSQKKLDSLRKAREQSVQAQREAREALRLAKEARKASRAGRSEYAEKTAGQAHEHVRKSRELVREAEDELKRRGVVIPQPKQVQDNSWTQPYKNESPGDYLRRTGPYQLDKAKEGLELGEKFGGPVGKGIEQLKHLIDDRPPLMLIAQSTDKAVGFWGAIRRIGVDWPYGYRSERGNPPRFTRFKRR